jgi:O-antigen/teichoic acid export membrane protein
VFNSEVAEQLRLPVALLAAGWYLNGTLTVPYMMSLAAGKPQIAARQNALALIVVLPVTVVAVYTFGLAGAALSWVIYHLFAYSYGLPRICRECLRFPVGSWLREIAAWLLLIGVTYGAGYATAVWLGGAILPLAIGFVVASCVYLLVGRRLFGSANRRSHLLQRAA